MNRIVYLLALPILLVSCNADDIKKYKVEESVNVPLQIEVTDSHSTRASQENLMFNFEDGDRVGVFKVSADGIVTSANVVFTLNDGQWTTTGSITFDNTSTYYAYYPASGTTNAPTVTGLPQVGDQKGGSGYLETEFFDQAITAWTPQTDQSTQEAYTKSDLMVSLGFIENGKVYFPMRHQMALARISIGTTTVSGSGVVNKVDNSYYWTDNTVYASTSWTSGRNPLKNGNYYYYLVNPQKTDVTLGGSDDSDDFNNSWTQTISGLSAGLYKDYIVRPPAQTVSIERTYTIQKGDVFYQDGSLSHSADPILLGKRPIGIVVLLQNENASAMESGYNHGLVMALTDLPESKAWASYTVAASGHGYDVDETYTIGGKDVLESYNGNGTDELWRIIKESVYGLEATNYLGNETCGHSDHDAFKSVKSYQPAPSPAAHSNCSGWFVIGAGQWIAMFNSYVKEADKIPYKLSYNSLAWNFTISQGDDNHPDVYKVYGKIEDYFTSHLVAAVSDAAMIQSQITYWTATEHNAQGAVYTVMRRNGGATIYKMTKYYPTAVRPFLAF